MKRWLKHALKVFILLSIIPASCNISGINRVVKTSKNIKSITPRVCNLELFSSGANGDKLGFINKTPVFSKHKYRANDSWNNGPVRNLKEDIDYFNHSGRVESPLFMKPNTNEVTHSKPVGREGNRAASLSKSFVSPLSAIRESMSRVTKEQMLGVAEKLMFGVANHVSSLGFKNEFRELVLLFPLPRTVLAVQMLASLPLWTYRWLLGVERPPSFNVPPYQLEKVDFSREGLLKSVKKSLKNGYSRTKAYVKAYRTVLLQGGYLSILHFLSTSRGFMRPEFGFLRFFEPLFVSLLTYMLEGTKLDSLAYLSLLPVVTGLLYTTYGKRLTSASFLRTLKDPRVLAGSGSVLLYNLVSALQKMEFRKFFAQNVDRMGKNLTPFSVNLASNLLGALMFLPFALRESPYWREVYSYVFKMIRGSTSDFLKHLALSTLYSATMIITAFNVMSNLSPVTQSLVNSLKTTLGGVLDSYVLNKKLHKHQLLGSLLAIAGALAYSLFKD